MNSLQGGHCLRRRVAAFAAAFSFLFPVIPAAAADARSDLAPGIEAADEQEIGVNERRGRTTGYAIPRFVSLKSNRARMRIGPSTDHATTWVYTRQGLPFEITDEYGNWRRVRDFEGVTGWMSAALLAGDRTAVVGPWLKDPLPLRRSAAPNGRIEARLSPRVVMQVRRCDGTWCTVTLPANGLTGYIEQSSLWGVYPGERFD